jgi:hypothetical protein
MNPHQSLDTPAQPQYSLPAPLDPLPPSPRNMGRNIVIPTGRRPPIRQVEPSQIIDRRLASTFGKMRRTLKITRHRASPSQSLDNLHFYISPSSSSSTNISSLVESTLSEGQSKADFADHQRVVEITKIRQLDRSATCGTGSNDKNSIPDSAMPMFATPFEDSGSPQRRLSIATKTSLHDSAYHLTPIDTDLSVLEMIAAMPEPISSSTGTSLRRTSTIRLSKSSSKETIRKRNPSVTAYQLSSGSVVAVIIPNPEPDEWKQSVYKPGRINIEAYSPGAVSFNFSHLNWFQEGAETVETKLRNEVEESMLDEIVDFFESFGSGFGHDTLNTSLDMSWEETAVYGPQFTFLTSQSAPKSPPKSPRGSSLDYEAPSSWSNALPGETFNLTEESSSLLYTDFSESGGRQYFPVLSDEEKDDLNSIPFYPGLPFYPGFPTNPLPAIPTTLPATPTALPDIPTTLPALPTTPPPNSSRKSKSTDRVGNTSLHPRISLRRLLRNAGSMV